jgi:hypothetical protein
MPREEEEMRHGTWRVFIATTDELESRLNELEQDGFEVFAILPVGVPEPQGRVPRDEKTLAERTPFAVMARKPPA